MEWWRGARCNTRVPLVFHDTQSGYSSRNT
jgi:hypothetical protein